MRPTDVIELAPEVRVAVVSRLLALPTEIATEEMEMLHGHAAVVAAEEHLATREATLITSGEINGSNEAARKAALHLATEPERKAAAEARALYAVHQLRVRRLNNELAACRALSRFMLGTAGGEG